MTDPGRQTIVVAALTYKRAEMLAALLESLLKLERPAGWTVRFLIVDNDPEASARATVEAAVDRFRGLLDYVVEPEPGIPFGRNRAMHEARVRGATLQCFLDDDGYPDPTWLRQLLAHHERTGAAVVGGPVRLMPPPYPIGPWKRFLTRSVMGRNAYVESIRARAAASGHAEFQTANWMADLDWVGRHEIQFSTAMRFTGGTDTAFLKEVQAKGGRAAWCERAVVYDHWQAERISVRYLFVRGKAQGMVQGRLVSQSGLRSAVGDLKWIIRGIGTMLVPIHGWASFTLGLHWLAMAIGRLKSRQGETSMLYARDKSQCGDS